MQHWKTWTIAALVVAWSTAAAATTHNRSMRVIVRTYHAAPDDEWLGAALATAHELLSAVSVNIEWVSCGDPVLQPVRCLVPLSAGELAVRFSAVPCRDEDAASVALGDSLIDSRAHAGTLATIYINRVAWLAGRSGVTMASLGGRAIAHEIGHLLMATPDHDTTGLMRAHWTASELARDDPRDWAFTSADAKAIKRRSVRDAALRHARLSDSVASSSPG